MTRRDFVLAAVLLLGARASQPRTTFAEFNAELIARIADHMALDPVWIALDSSGGEVRDADEIVMLLKRRAVARRLPPLTLARRMR